MIITDNPNIRIGIIGAGGLGKEVLCTLGEIMGWPSLPNKVKFLVEESFMDKGVVHDISVLPLTTPNLHFDYYVLAIGDLAARIRILNTLPSALQYATVIHPSVQLTPFTKIGEGSIVLGQVLLSCDVEIGKYALINPGTTISHDSTTGDHFMASPGVNISGNCKIGHRVFMGTNACTRNAISIGDDVVIGMGAVVTKDLPVKGTYIGNPASLI